MTESLMGETTGQAGVTIDLTIEGDGITVGSVVYTDEGSLSLNTISVTGTNAAGDANQAMSLSQTVDVLENGDLQIVVSPEGGEQYLNVSVGDVRLRAKPAITAGMTDAQKTAATDLVAGQESELVNNLDMTVRLSGTSTTTVHNVDVENQTLADFDVTGTAATTTAGLVISQNAAFQITDLDVGLFGYTAAQAATTEVNASYVATAKSNYETGYNNALAADSGTPGTNVATFLTDNAASVGDANANGVVDTGTETTALTSGVSATIAGRAAVSITGLTLDNNGGAINLNQKIWANDKGVSIQIAAFEADMNIAGIAIGGESIGSLAINDISIAGVTQTIYGH
jgi:hypothetical protein